MDVDRRADTVRRDRIEHALETAATAAARKAARQTARRAAGGYFVLLFALLVGAVYTQQHTNHRLDGASKRQEIANIRLTEAELLQCARVQTQRESENVSEARQYLLLDAIAKSPRASRTVAERYGNLARTTLYAPPTDCAAAVGHPNTYKRPPSIAFYATPPGFADRLVAAAQMKRPQPTLNG